MSPIIYKYHIDITHQQFIKIPAYSKILSIHRQNGELKIWMLVDPDTTNTEKRGIACYGTGQRIFGDAGVYITTLVEGDFVWHFFDMGEM